MTIFLVRHGETAPNRDGQGLGRSDVPLTAHGLAQAGAVALALNGADVRAVLSSPLARAREVAELIARPHGVAVEFRDELTELDVGETEGMDFASMRAQFAGFLQSWAGDDGWRTRMPGGESIEDVALRLEAIIERLSSDQDGDLVLVSHNFVLRTLLSMLVGVGPERWRAFQIDLCSVSTVIGRGGRFWVKSVNDTCHLSNLSLA
jgi:broad specificity phosphatase PhoE